MFETAGYNVSASALEKPYPQVLEKIFSRSGAVVVFADFAGRIAPLISELNSGRNLVLILDHHPAVPSSDPDVINLDAELFGLKGDRDISASAVCYLFASVFMQEDAAGPLSPLGVLGAIGDGFLVDGALSGVNSEIFGKARSMGLMRSVRGRTCEEYFINLGGTEYPALFVCSALDTLGGVGYYQGGTETGVEACLNGFSGETLGVVEELRRRKEEIFKEELDNLSRNIRTTAHLQWFDVEDRFRPMGVKMIGVFCTELKDTDLVDRTKYLAGFQTIPDTVPGFGAVSFDSTKISMRVSGLMTDRIRSGECPGLDELLPAATERLGGFIDACHSLSAATTVRGGEQEALIRELEVEIEKGKV